MRDFNHTVKVLVKAYLNGTLKHGSCRACAVGNILGGYAGWANIFTTTSWAPTSDQELLQTNGKWYSKFYPWGYKSSAFCEARDVIERSGYTWQELAKIEFAFESVREKNGCIKDDDIFTGLMAVVDVLADIHGINLEAKESAKQLFVKA